MCTCMWVYAYACRDPRRSEALGPLELAAVTDGYEPADTESVWTVPLSCLPKNSFLLYVAFVGY